MNPDLIAQVITTTVGTTGAQNPGWIIVPTPYPIPAPSPTATIDIAPFWSMDTFSPLMSASQSVLLWVQQYDMLKWLLILGIVWLVLRYMMSKVQRATEDV